MRFYVCVLAPLACLLAPAQAATYTVFDDGTGDFPTIQAAVEAVTDGDIIELGNGTFIGDGNRDIDYLGKAVTIRSQSGSPDACTIHCDGSPGAPHRGFLFQTGEGPSSVLEGVTILEGLVEHPAEGGAILCGDDCSPTIVSCVFWGNRGSAIRCGVGSSLALSDCFFSYNQGLAGGAISADRCALTILDCDFVKNTTVERAGAIWGYGVDAEITRCWFYQNTSDGIAAVSFQDGSSANISDCLFDSNTSSGAGAALTFWLSGPNLVENCTFTGNIAGYEGAAIWSEKVSYTHLKNSTFSHNHSPDGTILAGNYQFTMENCIVAFSSQGPGVWSHYDYAELTCCDIFGNEGGDWVGSIADQLGINGNIWEDPLFCAPETGDFRLDITSPCAEENNPECGQIGAWPVGCGDTPVIQGSWGSLKIRYR